jgi:hypothetical protein
MIAGIVSGNSCMVLRISRALILAGSRTFSAVR